MSIMKIKIRWAGMFFLLWAMLLACCVRFAPAAEVVDPYEQVKRMGRGMNILGYDPIWKSFEKSRFKEQHFKLIRDGGFQTVRMNLHALQLLKANNDYRLGDDWLKTLDWAVKNALANNLIVILDLHNYTDIAKDPMGFKPRFLAYWKQIAARFRDAPNTVLFEVLNEPNGKLTPKLWNEFLGEAMGIIRASNPVRTVVIGPPSWNGIGHLQELTLPEDDRNIIVTVHYYEPMEFTHQGAPWEKETAHLSGVQWGSEEEKRKVDSDFGGVQKWSLEHHRPILLGEFGAYEKGPMDSRARYIAYVARVAESQGWAWTYWQFDDDFIAFDIEKAHWVEPIRKALIP